MKIAYFGGDMFYDCMEMLVQEGHEIIALFIAPTNENEYDGNKNIHAQLKKLAIPVISSKPTIADIEDLGRKNCDMILSAGYSYKIPPLENASIPYYLNIHPSSLPEGGGPMPLPLVIVKGLAKTGVTLHKLSNDWDAGDIILQEDYNLSGQETTEDLLCKSQKIARDLLKKFLASPQEYWTNASPQICKDGDYWPMQPPETFLVDYTKDFETISRHLRAHRFINMEGNIEFISNIVAYKQKHESEVGAILSERNGTYLVAATNGLVSFTIRLKPSPNYNPIK